MVLYVNDHVAPGFEPQGGSGVRSAYVATINGTSSSETLTGGSGNDRIWGNGGDDTLIGGAGNDELHGGNGDDVLDPGSGKDKLFGDSGDDRLKVGLGDQEYDGGNGFDTFDASEATRGLTINLETETVTGLGNSKIENIEGVVGSTFADTITGSSEDEVLIGNGGSDVVRAGGGSDTLVAGAGSDKLYGEAGSDTLVYNATSGSGYTHVMDGGSGSDVLQLQFTAAQYTSVVQTEISAFQTFAADPANAGKTFTFSAVGNLQVSNIESVQVLVDGAPPVVNAAPVIDPVGTTCSITVAHLGSIAGAVAATDANGDALTYAVQTGPAHGTLLFTDTNGNYTYTAGDYVGSDSFTLQVSDGRGGIATHVVNVGVTNAAPQIDAASTTSFVVGHNQGLRRPVRRRRRRWRPHHVRDRRGAAARHDHVRRRQRQLHVPGHRRLRDRQLRAGRLRRPRRHRHAARRGDRSQHLAGGRRLLHRVAHRRPQRIGGRRHFGQRRRRRRADVQREDGPGARHGDLHGRDALYLRGGRHRRPRQLHVARGRRLRRARRAHGHRGPHQRRPGGDRGEHGRLHRRPRVLRGGRHRPSTPMATSCHSPRRGPSTAPSPSPTPSTQPRGRRSRRRRQLHPVSPTATAERRPRSSG